MQKSLKNAAAIVLTAVLSLSLSLPVWAAEEGAASAFQEQTLAEINAPYKQIIDDLNAEYQEEREQAGGLWFELQPDFDAREIGLSPEAFAAQARADMEEAIANNKSIRSRFDGSEWKQDATDEEIAEARAARSTRAYQRTEKTLYHNATLTGTLYINPSNGNVTFESINKIQSVPHYIDPAFYANTHTYRLIDGARTCEVTFTGELFKASGYVAHDYESIIEFYASNNDLF